MDTGLLVIILFLAAHMSFIGGCWLLGKMEERQTTKISRLEDMVKALLDNAGIDFEPSEP